MAGKILFTCDRPEAHPPHSHESGLLCPGRTHPRPPTEPGLLQPVPPPPAEPSPYPAIEDVVRAALDFYYGRGEGTYDLTLAVGVNRAILERWLAGR